MEHIHHGDFSVSGTLTLTTIPRASKVFATNADIGSASTITINKADKSFTHTLEYSFEGLTGTIIEKTSQESVGWTVPTSFFQKIPNNFSGTVTITCKTYSGDTLVGSSTTTMTASVPTSGTYNSSPIIDTATAVDTNQDTIDLTGNKSRLVNYFSKVKLNVTGRCINYANFNSLKENETNFTTSTVSNSGVTTITGEMLINIGVLDMFKIFMYDKRGLWATKALKEANGDFTIVPYTPLTMKANVERVSQTSNSIKLNFSGNFFNGYFDEAKSNFNNLKIKWRYKLTDSGTWITEGADDTENGWHNLTLNTDFKYDENKNTYQSNGDIVISDIFDYQQKYTVEINYSDELSSYSVQKPLPAGKPNHDYGVDDEGNNYFNVNGNTYINGPTQVEAPIYFNNKNDFFAIKKTRTIDGTDYTATFGVGAEKSAAIEIKEGNTILGRLNVMSDGKIINYVTGKRLIEDGDMPYKVVELYGIIREKGVYTLNDTISNYDEIRIWASANVWEHRQMCNWYRYNLWDSMVHFLQYTPNDWDTDLVLYDDVIDTSGCTNFGVDDRHIFKVEGIRYFKL